MGFITEFLDPLKRGGPEGLGFRGSRGGSRGVQGVQRVHGGPGGVQMGSRGYRGSSKRGLGYRPGPLFSGSMRLWPLPTCGGASCRRVAPARRTARAYVARDSSSHRRVTLRTAIDFVTMTIALSSYRRVLRGSSAHRNDKPDPTRVAHGDRASRHDTNAPLARALVFGFPSQALLVSLWLCTHRLHVASPRLSQVQL